jgi:hypothetical protein
VAGRVQDLQGGAGHLDQLAVGQVTVGRHGAVRQPPEGQVVGVQQHRGAHGLTEGRRDPDVVVVCVGAQHGQHLAARDQLEDRRDVVGRVDHDALGVVADHPHVVVDVERLAVQAERAGDDGVVDPGAHAAAPAGASPKTTTERSTPPAPIFSKAASMSPMPISSVTKASRGSRPWR